MKTLRMKMTLLISILGFVTTAWAGPKEDTAFLPADTQMFIQLDFASLKKTPIFTTMVANTPVYAQGVAEIKKMTGIDVNQDVKTVTMGLMKGNDPNAVIVIIDTPMKSDSPAMKEAGVEKVSFGGQAYYRVGSKEDGAVANYKGRTILTQEKRLKTILSGKARPPKNLMTLSNARQKGAQLWIFGTPPDRATGNAPFRPENIHGSLDLSTGLKVFIEADTTKEFAAQATSAFNDEKKKMANDPQLKLMGLGTIVEKVQFSAQGKRIKLSLDLNAAEMNQVTNILKMMLMAGGAAPPSPDMPNIAPTPSVPPTMPPSGTPIQKKAP